MMDTPISLLHLICVQNNTKADYTLLSREGQVHMPTFTYRVQVNQHSEEASGQSKKKAKHLAAKKMILCLLNDPKIIIKEDRQAILDSLQNTDESSPALDRAESPERKSESDTNNNAPNSAELSNPIGKLQEICMKKHWHPPLYREAESSGLPHERMFTFQCIIEGMNLSVEGCGKSKKSAKREAAEKMFILLKNEHLDKVDEILDRIPKKVFATDMSENSFNLRNEIVRFQASRDNNKRTDDEELRSFLKRLRDNKILEEKIKNVVPDPREFMKSKFQTVMDDAENLLSQIAEWSGCELVVTLHPEKNQLNQLQYWAELVCLDQPHQKISVCGKDEDRQIARKIALTQLFSLFVFFYFYDYK